LKTAVLVAGVVTAAGCRSSHESNCCARRIAPIPLPANESIALKTQIEPVSAKSAPATAETEVASFEEPLETGSSAPDAAEQVTGAELPVPRGTPTSQMVTRIDAATSAGDESQMAHAKDYSWLQGTLEYIHSNSGRWKLRYAPLWADDRFGGSLTLDPDAWLDKFHEGDVIYVEGELTQSRPSGRATVPVYRVHSIRAIQIAQ
jgi:hypothetical protein